MDQRGGRFDMESVIFMPRDTTKRTQICKYIMLFCAGSFLFLNGCAMSVSPPVPNAASQTSDISYSLSKLSSLHSNETRQYLQSRYSSMFNGDVTDPEMEMVINCVERDTPGFGQRFLTGLTFGFIPWHYKMTEQCDIKIIGPDKRIVHESSARGAATSQSWGYFGMFMDGVNRESWAIIPAEKRAELIAASSALENIARSEDQIVSKLRQNSNDKGTQTIFTSAVATTKTQKDNSTPTPSYEIVATPGTTVTGVRWAVIIGVSQYQDTRIPSLRYASADARSFYDWAVSQKGGKYSPARVKLMIDPQATNANIKDALFNWLGQSLEEDIVTIYFAGHGSAQSPDHPDNLFLLPYDCKYDNISTTGFPMWDIETALKRYIKAKKVVVIADACHSGGVGHSFDIARRSNRGIKVNPISTGIQDLSKIGDGVCVISASDEKQFSQESKDWGGGHGVFTYFLLKGLNGDADYNKDISVSLGEITSYLSQEVRRATKNVQSPTIAGRYDPALTIGK